MKFKPGDRVVFVRDDKYQSTWCKGFLHRTFTIRGYVIGTVYVTENSYGYQESWLEHEAFYNSPLYSELK